MKTHVEPGGNRDIALKTSLHDENYTVQIAFIPNVPDLHNFFSESPKQQQVQSLQNSLGAVSLRENAKVLLDQHYTHTHKAAFGPAVHFQLCGQGIHA